METNEQHRHPWFECDVCRERVNRQMDARLRDRLIADGVPTADADLLIAEAREMGQGIRKARAGGVEDQ